MKPLLHLLCLLFIIPLQAQNWNAAKLSDELIFQLEQGVEEQLPVQIILKDRVDVIAMQQGFRREGLSRHECVKTLVTSLKAKAETTQGELLRMLRQSDQLVDGSLQPMWITNMIGATVEAGLLEQLSWHEDVDIIEYNAILDQLAGEYLGPAPPSRAVGKAERDLRAINAHRLWEMGYTGYGTKVFVLDTGVDGFHPALRHNFRGLYVPLEEAWPGYAPVPVDCHSFHGTHASGTVCGLDRLNDDTIGVAYNALWMASPSVACTYAYTNMNSTQALQWALDPDEDPFTTDDLPDVISNSWSRTPFGGECTSQSWTYIFDAMDAAGVAVIFSTGGEGPDPGSMQVPGILNYELLKSFCVGSVDGTMGGFPINEQSSRGPSSCSLDSALMIKPEVVAPGMAVRSAIRGGGYGLYGGLSAVAHVSGVILLLKEAFPQLSGPELMMAVYMSAIDLGRPGEDNDYGRGMIDALAAFNYLIDQGHTPVDPYVENDALLIHMDYKPLDCIDAGLDLSVWFENSGTEMLNKLELGYEFEGADGTFSGSLEWSGLLAPKTRIQIPLKIENLEAGAYSFTLKILNVNDKTDEREYNNILRRTIDLYDIPTLHPPTASTIDTAEACSGSHVLLQSNYAGTGTVQWLNESGDLLGEGPSYLTDRLTEEQLFYMDVRHQKKLGLSSKDEGYNFLFDELDAGLLFDCITPFDLKSVKVYAEAPGLRIIVLVDEDDNIVHQKIVNIPVGESRITLDFSVSPGKDYALKLYQGRGLTSSGDNVNFPYEIYGVANLKRSTTNNGLSEIEYYYFYDWEVGHQHVCGPAALEIELAGGAPPLAQMVLSANEIDLDTSGLIQFVDRSVGATAWLWNFGNGDTSTEQNPMYTYTLPGTYTVSLTVVDDEGCSDAATATITVIDMTSSTTAVELARQLSIFPNPAQSQIYIRMETANTTSADILLLDVLGREVQAIRQTHFKDQNIQLDVSAHQPGIYFVLVRIDKQQLIKKLVLTD